MRGLNQVASLLIAMKKNIGTVSYNQRSGINPLKTQGSGIRDIMKPTISGILAQNSLGSTPLLIISERLLAFTQLCLGLIWFEGSPRFPQVILPYKGTSDWGSSWASLKGVVGAMWDNECGNVTPSTSQGVPLCSFARAGCDGINGCHMWYGQVL